MLVQVSSSTPQGGAAAKPVSGISNQSQAEKQQQPKHGKWIRKSSARVTNELMSPCASANQLRQSCVSGGNG